MKKHKCAICGILKSNRALKRVSEHTFICSTGICKKLFDTYANIPECKYNMKKYRLAFKEKRSKYCHEHYLIYHKESQRILDNLKINGCSICGYNKCYHALDFHHTNPKDKKFNLNVSTMTKDINILAKEVNKCILLCKNCHYEIEFCNVWTKRIGRHVKRGKKLSELPKQKWDIKEV